MAVALRDVLAKVERLAEGAARTEGYVLIDLEHAHQSGRLHMTFVIDGPDGITLGDCQAFSRVMDELLTAEDLFTRPYVIEVASPGLDRVLTRDFHFEHFAGRRVQVTTYAPVEGRKEFQGTLEGLDPERNLVITDAAGVAWTIPRELVAKARLHTEF